MPKQDGDKAIPLHEQVRRALGADIADGRYELDRPFVTEREVCRRFGVSSITAARALNDLVAEGLLVRRRGLGTFVAERRPVPRDAPTVACILNGLYGLQGAHLANLLVGAESACADLGLQLVLLNARGDAGREAAALKRAVDTHASGIVIYPMQGQEHREAFEAVRRQGIPLVLLDRYRPDLATDCVIADNLDLGYRITRRLLERGHEHIALLWGETECTSVRDRLTGHLRALTEAGVAVRPDLTVLVPYETLPTAERLARLTSLLEGPSPPTVLNCSNGYVLATVAHDLVLLGIHVPDGIDLACMDDAGPHDLLALAAVEARLPSEAIGRTGVELLAERMSRTDGRPGPPRRIVLPVGLSERESAPGHLGTMSGRAGRNGQDAPGPAPRNSGAPAS
ncbi:MAG TPA: LacI family DNA-binding transcriptional regulator [Acidimicrobiales bacterium]|nr:LacI family DNA-binding transcriptional regulator [Acidimicrobiales bacterium]